MSSQQTEGSEKILPGIFEQRRGLHQTAVKAFAKHLDCEIRFALGDIDRMGVV